MNWKKILTSRGGLFIILPIFIIVMIIIIATASAKPGAFEASNDEQDLDVMRPADVVLSDGYYYYIKEVVIDNSYTPCIIKENYNNDINIITIFDPREYGFIIAVGYDMMMEDDYLYLHVSSQQTDGLFKIDIDTGSNTQYETGNFVNWCVHNEVVYYQASQDDGTYRLTALHTGDGNASVPKIFMDEDSDLAIRGDWLYYTNDEGYLRRYNTADKRHQKIIDEPIYCFDLLGDTVIFSPDIRNNRYSQSTCYFEMGTTDIKTLDAGIASSFSLRIVRDSIYFIKKNDDNTEIVVYDADLDLVSEQMLSINDDFVDILDGALIYGDDLFSSQYTRIIDGEQVVIESPLIEDGDFPVIELDRYHIVDCCQILSISNDDVQQCFDIADSALSQSAASAGINFDKNVIILDNTTEQIASDYYETADLADLLAENYDDIDYIVCITGYTLGEKFNYLLGPAVGYRINMSLCVIDKTSGKVINIGVIEGPEPPDIVDIETEIALGNLPDEDLLLEYLSKLS